MIDFSNKIFVYHGFIDMRKSIDGLCVLLASNAHEIHVGSCFLFINKGGDKIKILVREHNGFVLLYKRLDRGRFHLKLNNQSALILTNRDIRFLLDGLDYASLKTSKETHQKVYF
ncbi:MAG: hypothetical protein CNLJKLNK_01425 [Holosporales bacterium]